jgi:hypothetical protein
MKRNRRNTNRKGRRTEISEEGYSGKREKITTAENSDDVLVWNGRGERSA